MKEKKRKADMYSIQKLFLRGCAGKAESCACSGMQWQRAGRTADKGCRVLCPGPHLLYPLYASPKQVVVGEVAALLIKAAFLLEEELQPCATCMKYCLQGAQTVVFSSSSVLRH